LWLRAGTVALIVAALLLVPAAFRLSQRLTRVRRIRRGERPADAAWTELTATALDLGAGGSGSETPRAFATRITERDAFDDVQARDAVLRMRDAVERERYGPVDGEHVPEASAASLVSDLEAARSALLDDAGAAERARAALLPHSLFDSVRRVLGDRVTPGA
jgi:hypothetical protein